MSANCAKYWFLVCRFCVKYWCLLCRLCAKLPVSGLLPSIVVACPNYRWLCFRCMLMYCVLCRCMVAIASDLVNCPHVIGCVAWFINWRLYELWCASTNTNVQKCWQTIFFEWGNLICKTGIFLSFTSSASRGLVPPVGFDQIVKILGRCHKFFGVT